MANQRTRLSRLTTFVSHALTPLLVAILVATGMAKVIAQDTESGDAVANVVRAENISKPGTQSWKIPGLDQQLAERTNFKADGDDDNEPADSGGVPFPDGTTANLMEGYAGAQSVNRGGTINFHVSSTVGAFDLHVYRMGWYNGDNATEITVANNIPGAARATPAPDANGMVTANWPVSYTLQTQAAWTSGMYLATLNKAGNALPSAYVPFVVRNDASTSPFIYVAGLTTYQAYNDWGGKSLYEYNSPGGRAKKVSFDRPYKNVNGAGLFFDGDYYMIRFLEREGYDVSYAASEDLERNPSLINNHRAFLSSFHDEYWSPGMRSTLENAVAAGKHAAFLGANSIYWQVRFENAADGRPYRTMVCYKDAALDPVTNTTATVQFRQPPVNRPENELLGAMYEGDFAYGNSVPWVVTGQNHWIYNGTGLRDGDQIPKLVGYEWDRAFGNGKSPAGLVTLSNSTPGAGLTQQATIHQKASGALVFNASTIYWPWLLDNTSWGTDARVQQMTRNLLNAMKDPAGPPATTLPTTVPPTTVPLNGPIVKEWRFEDGGVDTWQPWFGGTVTNTTTGARTGSRALRITASPAATVYGSATNVLSPGTTYEVTGYMRQDVLGGRNGIVQFYNASGTTGTAVDLTFTPDSNEWIRFSATFVVPAGTTIVFIALNDANTSFTVDDVTITQPGGVATTTTLPVTTTTTAPTTTIVGATTTVVGATTTLSATTTTAPATTVPTGNTAIGWNFEDGTTQGWGPWFGASTVTNVATGGRTAPRALRINDNASIIVSTATLVPGQTYSLNGYVKSDSVPPYRGGVLQFYNGSGALSSTTDLTFTPDSGGWTRMSGTFTVPAGTATIFVALNGGGVAFLLDDVVITGGTVTTTTTLPVTTIAVTTTVAGATTTLPATTVAATTTTVPGATTTVPATTVPTGNLAIGWTFEDGQVGGWTPWFGSATVTNVATGGRTAPRALRINDNSYVSISPAVLVSGQAYTLNGYVKPDAVPPYRAGEFQFYTSAGALTSVPVSFIADTGGWIRMTASFTVPVNTSTIFLTLNGGGVAFLLDDVAITGGSTPTTTTTTPAATTTLAATTTAAPTTTLAATTTAAPTTTRAPTTTAAPTTVPSNLVAQWNFEDGTAQSWTRWTSGTVANTATGARSGSRALAVTQNASLSISTTGLTVGQRYGFTGYMKTTGATGTRSGQVQFTNAGGQSRGTTNMVFTADANGWVKFTASFLVPSGSARVLFGVNGGGTAFVMDDDTLTRG